MPRALRDGLAAGAAGTCAEAAWSLLLLRLRRRAPVYDPPRMVRRMLRRYAGRDVGARTAAVVGTLMRIGYGPTWGVLAALLTRRRRPAPVSAVALATAIWLFELAALPRTGATPPLREWPRGEVALDSTNTLVYSAVTCTVLGHL